MSDKTIYDRFGDALQTVVNPPLDGTNPHFRSKFATLKAVLDTIKAACDEAGIHYQQRLVLTPEGYELHSRVFCGTDTIELSCFPIKTGTPQATGSEITYARRYIACVDFNIVGDPDDDGNAASKPSGQPINGSCLGCGKRFTFPAMSVLETATCPDCGSGFKAY